MKGAIFYSSKYGSTAQYAEWIREATDLPAFDVDKASSDPSQYDFLVLGSPVLYHKLMFHKWVKNNLAGITARPTILFSVSGAGAGAKLDAWLAGNLPAELVSHMQHVALRGRQDPNDLSWLDRLMLIIGGLTNSDSVAGREELRGFDYMDKLSIKPIVEKVAQLQGKALPSQKEI